MAIYGRFISTVVALSLAGTVTSSCGGDPLTAAALIGQVESSLDNTITSAGNQYNASAQFTAAEISNQLDKIERILGEKVNEPIANLDTTIQRQLFAARALAESLKTTVAELPQCIGIEGQLALSGVKSGVQTTLNAIPLADIEPTVYYINDPASRIPFMINSERMTGKPYAVQLHGSALPSKDDYCGFEGELQDMAPSGKRISHSIQLSPGSDSETIGAYLPKGTKAGQYNLVISAKEKWLGMCVGKRVEVGGLITVFDPVVVTPRVTLTPICEVRRLVEQPFNGSCTNGSRRHGKTCAKTYVFDQPGITFDDFTFEQGGHSAGASAQRSGEGVAVIGTASQRGKIEGGTSHVAWSGKLIGHVREGNAPGRPVVIPFPSGLRPGQAITVAFQTNVNKSCILEGWSGYADDPRQLISAPVASSDPGGQIETQSAEIRMVADIRARNVTVTRLKGGCL